jgi:DNA-binding response OmpR family regulator
LAHHLLLIEDDERLAEMVADYLEGAGFRVRHSITGRAGYRSTKSMPSMPSSSI